MAGRWTELLVEGVGGGTVPTTGTNCGPTNGIETAEPPISFEHFLYIYIHYLTTYKGMLARAPACAERDLLIPSVSEVRPVGYIIRRKMVGGRGRGGGHISVISDRILSLHDLHFGL